VSVSDTIHVGHRDIPSIRSVRATEVRSIMPYTTQFNSITWSACVRLDPIDNEVF